MAIQTLISLEELRDLRGGWAKAGDAVAFVPTMGALHEGHLSLVREAMRRGDRTLVSIFVNPAQFGPGEDFERYPRTLKADLARLEALGVDAVFCPNNATMYPEGFQTYVRNDKMAAYLCGQSRPGHFEGVLTVVLKLLQLVRPHTAVFGKKDYQQWRLIQRMARDLNLDVDVVGAPIVREEDGLAMSSRNRYLSETERPVAVRLHQGLEAAREQFTQGVREAEQLRQAFLDCVEHGQLELEYAELRRQEDLEEVDETVDQPAVLLVAARVGATRLIDNVEFAGSQEGVQS